MTTAAESENPFAGQGPVMLDIGDDVGALVVTMPASMEGVEVEIRPEGASSSGSSHGHDHDHGDDHGHDHDHDHAGGSHHPHVAVVVRPLGDRVVPSLVYPELVEGRYELYLKGTDAVELTVAVAGGEVATAEWPALTG